MSNTNKYSVYVRGKNFISDFSTTGQSLSIALDRLIANESLTSFWDDNEATELTIVSSTEVELDDD